METRQHLVDLALGVLPPRLEVGRKKVKRRETSTDGGEAQRLAGRPEIRLNGLRHLHRAIVASYLGAGSPITVTIR